MRNFVIVGIVVLMALIAFGPVAFAQDGGGRRPVVDKPGLEVPLVTPGPGWRPCPRCENGAYMERDRQKANVDTRPFDKHDISGVWSGDPMNLESNGWLLDNNTRPPFTPAGQKLFEATASDSVEWNSKDPMNVCDPFGYPRSLTYNYGVEFAKLPDRIIEFFEIGHWWRTIYTDGRALPPDPPITRYYGYAVGKWEGDTFVVESNGYDDRTWLGGANAMINGKRLQAGLPHSDEMRITERYRRLNYGLLELSLTINDPKVYTAAWTTVRQMTLIPNTELGEHLCIPSDSIEFNNRNIAPALKEK